MRRTNVSCEHRAIVESCRAGNAGTAKRPTAVVVAARAGRIAQMGVVRVASDSINEDISVGNKIDTSVTFRLYFTFCLGHHNRTLEHRVRLFCDLHGNELLYHKPKGEVKGETAGYDAAPAGKVDMFKVCTFVCVYTIQRRTT